MPWNNDKCEWGYPEGFSDAEAESAIKDADWSQAFFVIISAKKKTTKKAYLYHVFNNYRICLVADVHRKDTEDDSPWDIAGHCWIPGWDEFQLTTPEEVVDVVGEMEPEGDWEDLNLDENRFPHPA